MTILKSSRHQKIIGDFGEHLIANWLSRSGFEIVLVDHTGIDIVAYHSTLKRRIGVTVKSRTRNEGTEENNVTIFSDQHNRQKVIDACEAFGCEPWIGIYVEMLDSAELYLLSLDHFDTAYHSEKDRSSASWNMRERDKKRYSDDPEVKRIKISFAEENWNWE